MQALIDGDIVAYRCAASCEKQHVVTDDLDIAIRRMDNLLHDIVDATGSTEYKVFLTGSNNFRYEIYPEYKANRKDAPRPAWLQDCREHLMLEWKAEMEDGFEADDLMGIYQTDASIICSIDKDLLQVPGKHYNFVKQEFYDVDEIGGLRHFYFQLIMGDRADNIPGYDGLMRQKVPKFLQPTINSLMECSTENQMEELIRPMYTDEAQYHINKKLLWILREWPDGYTGEV